MANWDRITSRGNIEDRRGMAPYVSGVGLVGVALYVGLSVLAGADPTQILNQVLNVALNSQNESDTSSFAGNDAYEQFSSTVLGSANDLWVDQLKQQNHTYSPPRLVLFRNITTSGCGVATSQVGPHYCPYDQTIYLDETFFDELTTRLGAKGGDVAEAYVIAHEVGHHVQEQLGVLQAADTAHNGESENELSVKVELQADCYAGVWAHSVNMIGVLEPGEISEALDAAAAVGDDRIQQKVSGQISPETWTHGSSSQRVEWFNKGFEHGDYLLCDTF
ncbi:hypothetical protein HGA91_00305 [candidate division WWE3 bacterium]|nr:hypothetical protein [candidate division WWE3 bacterium]